METEEKVENLRETLFLLLLSQDAVNLAQTRINASENKRWCAFLDQYDARVAEFKEQGKKLQAFLDAQNAANAVSLRFNEYVRGMFEQAKMDTKIVAHRCTMLETMAFDTSRRLERAQEHIAQLENETSQLREDNIKLFARVSALEYSENEQKSDKLS